MATYRFHAARGPVIISSIQLKHVFQLGVSMPAVGVAIAFIIGYTIHFSLMYDYEWGCRNVYLPSVSRLLNLPLERIAWNILTLATVPLQLFVVIRQYILTFSTSNKQQFLRIVLVVSSVFQSLFLTLLATVGEREDGTFHVAFFSGFSVATITNYTVFSILMKYNVVERSEYGRRRIAVLLGLLVTLPIIFVSFILHNVFCITGAYETFAIFEYLTIILIYSFHLSNSYLFSDPTQKILICHRNGILSPVRI